MAPITSKKKAATASLKPSHSKRRSTTYGAPAQYGQSSRKGKRAWRKNVDIVDVEAGLEQLREEERVAGGPLHEKADKDLFVVDVTGDENLRKSLRKSRPLKSLAVLKERSAVPAVFSRTKPSAKRKAALDVETKDRLRRKANKTQLLIDGEVAEMTEAIKQSGKYDVWTEKTSDDEMPKKFRTEEAKEFMLPYVKKAKVKAPNTLDPNINISLPAISRPHSGASYNPTVESHQELLREANEIETRREVNRSKLEGMKEKLVKMRQLAVDGDDELGAPGMTIDNLETMEDVETTETAEEALVKAHERKTRAQRNKAARVLAEKKAALARRDQKRFLAAVDQIPSFKKAVDAALTKAERTAAKRKFAAAERIKAGLAGQRLGRHKVPEANIDVQLGEELAETLREMKPEGNLFRDRFLSMQHRALVEPRVLLAPGRNAKAKAYEVHMYKKFQ